jgi:UDP-N-acetyl-D-mannosaminuronate dehydrogenase
MRKQKKTAEINKKGVEKHAGIKPALKTANAVVMLYKHGYYRGLQYKQPAGRNVYILDYADLSSQADPCLSIQNHPHLVKFWNC